MNLRRGLLRFALCLVGLWLAYWSFAYVFRPLPPGSILPPSPILSLPLTVDIFLVVCMILSVLWVVLGLRRR